MHIVTDSGSDLSLTFDEREALNVHVVPLIVQLNGVTYREDVDIEPAEFYELLESTGGLPSTSQPSAGDFAEMYRQIATVDRGILSIHISSGLSGTVQVARAGADLVPEADVTIVDAKTLSAAAGWQVEAAARAVRAGWSKDRVLSLVEAVGSVSESIYTLNELKYLIHGGRISHMTGLIASVLNIKPLIGVEKQGGTYVQLGQERSFKKAVRGLVDLILKDHAAGSDLYVQVLHAFNPEGAATLKDLIDQTFNCRWQPLGMMSLVLGAHTGPSMVGVAYAPATIMAEIPVDH